MLILTTYATAQNADNQKIAKQPDTLIFSDTTLLSGTALVTDSMNFEGHLTQQPTIALFKSMFVPGWGQFGNKKYIKGLCFFAFDAWMIYRAVNYRNSARDYWDKYENAATISEKNAYYSLYSDQKDDRNKFTWYAVITSFFAMFGYFRDKADKLHQTHL